MPVQPSTPHPARELLTTSELVRDERDPLHIHLRQWKGAGKLGPDQDSCRLLSPDLLCLARAFSLPTKVTAFGSVGELFSDICKAFQTYIELPERAPELLAAFVIGSWFPDRTQTTALLVIFGSSMDALPLLRILKHLCRRGLLVADMNSAALISDSMRLMPTLIMSYSKLNERLTRLMSVSSSPGHVVLVRGEPREILCAKAIFIGDDNLPEELARTALRVTVYPRNRAPQLSRTLLQALEKEFQNRLLAYRLTVGDRVEASDFEVPSFGSEMRLVARALGACIVDDPDLQRKIVDVLKAQDTENRMAHSSDLRCVVVEAVLFHKRERKKDKFLVGEITKTVNDLLKCRNEPRIVVERAVGEQLKRLGFRKRRNGAGIYISMDPETRELAERLARQYHVLSVEVDDERPPNDVPHATICK